MHWVDWTRYSRLVSDALAQGAELKKTSVEWDVSMGCDKPYYAEIGSQKPIDRIAPEHPIINGMARYITIATPCRKCGVCRENRRRYWKRRARQEIKQATRTWFGSLTINPHYRFMFSMRSKSRNFHASYGEISKELTKYFKRLRKAGYKFRYVAVAESHKDGYPHIHLLIHEGPTPVPKRVLQDEWPYGFTNFKLVENANAATAYVTKYLTKDARCRIRASQEYGFRSGTDLPTFSTTP